VVLTVSALEAVAAWEAVTALVVTILASIEPAVVVAPCEVEAATKQQLEATAATPSFCRVAEESEMRWTVDSLRTRAMTHQQQAYFPSI